MKKLLSIIILTLLWCNVVSADPKWNFVDNDNAVRVEINGETTFGDKFTYALLKENGKCDNMIIYFSSISNGKHDLNKILGLTIPVKINEETNLITLCVKHHAWIHNMRPGTWNNHSESIKSGLENARKKGRIGGRPTKLTPSVEEKILELKANGVSIKKIKEECGVGTASVYKVIKVRNFSHVVE